MAFEIPRFDRGWVAGATDLSAPATVNSIAIDSYRYMFVKFAGGLMVPCTAVSDAAVGVLQNKPAPGLIAQVRVEGVTRVRSNDAGITVGSKVYIDAFGMATRTQGGGTAGCVGIAEEVAAAGGGYVIAVCLKPFGAVL